MSSINMWACILKVRETYHSVTLLVRFTGSFAEIDFGSALSTVSV